MCHLHVTSAGCEAGKYTAALPSDKFTPCKRGLKTTNSKFHDRSAHLTLRADLKLAQNISRATQ